MSQLRFKRRSMGATMNDFQEKMTLWFALSEPPAPRPARRPRPSIRQSHHDEQALEKAEAKRKRKMAKAQRDAMRRGSE